MPFLKRNPTTPVFRFLLLSLLLGQMGCSIWMGFNFDPQKLPCDANGECLADYTCVDNECVFAAELKVGDTCVENEQCETGICADYYGEGCVGVHCALGNDTGKKCRTRCNIFELASVSCETSERCFTNEQGTFCQEGTCGVDSICGENSIPLGNGFDIVANRCFDVGTNGGDHPGICRLGCNPLLCTANGGCAGCPVAEASCEHVENINEFICLGAGDSDYNAPCGQETYCKPGSFCNLSGVNGTCAKYCLVGGGAPQCDAPQTCSPLSGVVGYCQ
ncbi:MAG: hypothetical protein GY822_15550 [Deltaproteobacteria bacterium]|nr:hypothetical protein [Deltaproteobacteria bacterium]